MLTDAYLCERHGAFEAESGTAELVHLQSGRRWRRWNNCWFRQHTHVDGIRFEIHEELDRLHAQGMRATAVTIAHRYSQLLKSYLQSNHSRRHNNGEWRLYGLPVSFSQQPAATVASSSAASSSTISAEECPSTEVNKPLSSHPYPPVLEDDVLEEMRWSVINFELAKETGSPPRLPFRFL